MKKISALLALILVLASAVTVFYGCDGGEASADAESKQAQSQAESAEELVKKDLNEATISFLVPDSSYVYYESFEIYAEEQNNEVINDAVYARNMFIEEYYNCTIAASKTGAIAEKIRQYVDSGNTDIDVYMPMMNDTVSVAADGYLYDLNEIGNIKLEKPWWDQTANSSLELGGKLYFTTGDISTLDNDCTMVMFFNKKLVREQSLESPYELVAEKKWTLDKAYEMSRAFTADNGDGVWNNEDKYGLHVAFNAPHSFFFGAGGRITEKDGESVKLVMDSQANVERLNKIFDIAYSNDVVTNKTAGCTTFESICEMFTNDKIIFTTFALIDIRQFRYAKNFEFGILPYPLYNQEQENYTCLISTSLVPAVAFATNCAQLDAASLVVEAMAFKSVETLTDAYYVQTLTYRDLRDDESGEMLDIIFASRAYDIGYIFNWAGVGGLIEKMNSANDSNFVSQFEAIKSAVTIKMNETLDAFAHN